MDLEAQGPFDVIFHKLTDVIAKADSGCEKEQQQIKSIQVNIVYYYHRFIVCFPVGLDFLFTTFSLRMSFLVSTTYVEFSIK